MTVSAVRVNAPRIAQLTRSKRARRFFGPMAAALREAGRRPGGAFAGGPGGCGNRAVSEYGAWRPSAA
jgi:hypothetical protein